MVALFHDLERIGGVSDSSNTTPPTTSSIDRRQFLRRTGLFAAAGALGTPAIATAQAAGESGGLISFRTATDSLYHGLGWESLNPGYWKIVNDFLRRRFGNYGDRARAMGFPYRYEPTGAEKRRLVVLRPARRSWSPPMTARRRLPN